MIAYNNQLIIKLYQKFNDMIFVQYRYAIYIINLTIKAEMNHIKNEIKNFINLLLKLKFGFFARKMTL